MKRAFTLIELMIVIAILAILMTITFRLTGTSKEDAARTTTIVKLQKIENCLSGYYAAFGSYPPVALHGSRDITCAVDDNGDQDPNAEQATGLDWMQVRAACNAQPFGCEYPPAGTAQGNSAEVAAIKRWSKKMAERVNDSKWVNFQTSGWRYGFAFTGQDELTGPRTSSGFNKAFPPGSLANWSQGVRLFKFGAMSYLLPRYLFMMRSDEGWFGEHGNVCLQWSDNNGNVPCNPLEGRTYDSWEDVKELSDKEDKSESQIKSDLVGVQNIPSQAVCARWMPNLEKVCITTCAETFFGINITEKCWTDQYDNGWTLAGNYDYGFFPPNIVPVHAAPQGGQTFCNGCITMKDGWDVEFYYYSPAPYQSYVIWSSGPNRKTFPPWASLEELSSADRKKAMEWKADDLTQMGEGIPGAKSSGGAN